MIKLIGFFVLLVSCSGVLSANFDKSDWIPLNEIGLLVKDQQFPRNRHRRGVIELQNFSKIASDGVMSMELLTEYDCKKGTFRLINYRGFSRRNLEGKLIYDWRGFDPRAFVGIPTGTPAMDVFEFVCGFKRKV